MPTRDPPREPGWYWYQSKKGEPLEVVLVKRSVNITVRRLLGSIQSDVPVSCVKGLWWGRVVRPAGAPVDG